ncbi:MAG: Gfo/Idh/MocA family oxidoreductase [Bacteroidales bacterium]|jgi:predicted dehydrogenase|nr:Gfo/Idh/MocA family oxidoreductase [Bacteroidales bacterium]
MSKLNRRDFLSSAALAGAGTLGGGALLSSCGGGAAKAPALIPLLSEDKWNIPTSLPDKAKDGVPLKAGVIGCGGRGSGAAENFLNAGPNLSITALGDVFADRIASCNKNLKEKFNAEVPADKCFVGFDAYQKVIDSGVDIVIVATPPNFRPQIFKAAVEAGKHSFLEKPVAVDAAGAKSLIATSKQAVAQGLVCITGTQRHHQRVYIEGYKQVQNGLIGDITSANVYWNGGQLWYRNKEKGWSDIEWMIRDWPNWTWLSGDHIVEQHVHNLDVFTWFSNGLKPVSAVGFGSRQRRVTGDQYDNFSIDYTYENGIHVHSMCRQINGCKDNVSEQIHGTKGIWYNSGEIKDLKGNTIWKYDGEKAKTENQQHDPYTLEHVNLVNLIRDKQPFSQGEETAISTLVAVMGRQSAYTGQEVTWDEVWGSDQDLMLENLSLKDVDLSKFPIPVPGKA